MNIIDIHIHVYPEKIVDAAGKSIAGFYDVELAHRGAVGELLEANERAGVTRCVVFSTATKASQVPSIDRFIIGLCREYPQFTGLGTMYPGFEAVEEELELLLEHGIHGIKLHPDCQGFNADDPVMTPVYREIARRGMFILFHSGDPRHGCSHPDRIARVARAFPEMPVIAAHCGGWMQWAEARHAFAGMENVWYDTSSTFGFGGNDPFFRALDAFGADRLMFGSDFPMWDAETEARRLLSLGLSDGENEGILHGNFERFEQMIAARL